MGVLNVISRRLAGLKKATGPVCVLKTLVQDFSVSNCPPPPGTHWRTGCNLGQHKIKCILSLSGQYTDVTINDQSINTQSCQTLQLLFFISLRFFTHI